MLHMDHPTDKICMTEHRTHPILTMAQPLQTEASSGVPTWTWGVIGAVVVVAFIVGAFILSRGDGDDDDKEWDY